MGKFIMTKIYDDNAQITTEMIEKENHVLIEKNKEQQATIDNLKKEYCDLQKRMEEYKNNINHSIALEHNLYEVGENPHSDSYQ